MSGTLTGGRGPYRTGVRRREQLVAVAIDVFGEHGFENTFRDKEQKAFKLDHMWLGSAKASDIDVAGPCNLAWETDQAAIEKHFDEISDHCPLIATVTLP